MMDRRTALEEDVRLSQIYASDTNPEVRKKVIGALFVSNDAKALVTLAKKETDPEMGDKRFTLRDEVTRRNVCLLEL